MQMLLAENTQLSSVLVGCSVAGRCLLLHSATIPGSWFVRIVSDTWRSNLFRRAPGGRAGARELPFGSAHEPDLCEISTSVEFE